MTKRITRLCQRGKHFAGSHFQWVYNKVPDDTEREEYQLPVFRCDTTGVGTKRKTLCVKTFRWEAAFWGKKHPSSCHQRQPFTSFSLSYIYLTVRKSSFASALQKIFLRRTKRAWERYLCVLRSSFITQWSRAVKRRNRRTGKSIRTLLFCWWTR